MTAEPHQSLETEDDDLRARVDRLEAATLALGRGVDALRPEPVD